MENALIASISMCFLLVIVLFVVALRRGRQPGDSTRMEATLRAEARALREELALAIRSSREEAAAAAEKTRHELAIRLDATASRIAELKEALLERLGKGLKDLQDSNEKRLEEMRATVDEKLHRTLETRLTQSFETVTRQLLAVQKGLSEMQTLAQDVGGLKKALTNVKTRGVLGEAQLGGLLEQFLSPGQYAANVRIRPRSSEQVEYAVRLPGPEEGKTVWLPIDAKFPVEDYQRLLEAYETGDVAGVEQSAKALETRFVAQAREISSKYIDPPQSTDFAIMFLPFEGLYAEALRRTGLFERLQREFHVTLAGPTTLAALLNSLQVGFRTLAIGKQTGEVWKILGAVKSEFGKFGEMLSAVHRNLEHATNNLEKVSDRTRQMQRKLDKVETLPAPKAGIPEDSEAATQADVDPLA